MIPWKELTEEIEPAYRNPQGAGQRPVVVEPMLHMRFLQR